MSDFAQHGLIATLQRLNDFHLDRIESELGEFARQKPIALVLPCHARDLMQPALAHIIAELRGAPWLGEVVVSLNGLTRISSGTPKNFLIRSSVQRNSFGTISSRR
jgi:glucosyl-3-phosphoglycerate synthase